MRPLSVAILAFSALLLAACGNKGPLVLPDQAAPAAKPPAPATPPPAANDRKDTGGGTP